MVDEAALKGIIAPECVKELQAPSGMGAAVAKGDIVGIRDAMGFDAKNITTHQLVITDEVIKGIPVRIYRKQELAGQTLPVMIYVHGGGFVGGYLHAPNVEQICRTFADHGDLQVISVGYRLAPEHPYPAGLTDCYQIVQEVAANPAKFNAQVTEMSIMGDSAGANVALATAILDSSFYQTHFIKKILAYYPVVDLTTHGQGEFWNPEHIYVKTPAERKLYDDYIAGFAQLENIVENMYAGPTMDRATALLSPLYADQDILKNLPPMHTIFGEFDPLRQQNEAFATRLAQLGNPETVSIYPGMIHAFMDKVGVYPEAEQAIDEGLQFLMKK